MMKKTIATMLVAPALALGLLTAAPPPSASAIPDGMGCETVRWGFLGSQRRTVCDTPQRGDGSWTRVRVIWTPAGYVPGYCSRYSCSMGYYRDESIQGREEYVVFPSNVLPDEPGWLPVGTNIIR